MEKQQPTKREKQTARARKAICAATIWCLDRFGYAETSINRITRRAGISRGALTHHFHSKEDLIVETFAFLLQEPADALVRRAAVAETHLQEDGGATDSFATSLIWMWRRLIDTREGNAFLEILIALRTDTALKKRMGAEIYDWNERIEILFKHHFQAFAAGVSTDRYERVMLLARILLRGLLVHKELEGSNFDAESLLTGFADMVSAYWDG